MSAQPQLSRTDFAGQLRWDHPNPILLLPSCFFCSQDIVNIILFNVVPQMIDIVVACSYLATKMQPWVAGIVLVTVSSYVPLTVCITERRGKVRLLRLLGALFMCAWCNAQPSVTGTVLVMVSSYVPLTMCIRSAEERRGCCSASSTLVCA